MSFPFKVSWANFLWCLSGTLELFPTACATPLRALLATAGRVQAMDAGCGSSTRGHWDGPVTCNKSHGIAARKAAGRKAPCEHDTVAMFGPWYHLLWLLSDIFTWFTRQWISKINIQPNMRLCCVLLVLLWGVKDSAKRFFPRKSAKTEMHWSHGFCSTYAAIAASDVYECMQTVKPSICSHIQL